MGRFVFPPRPCFNKTRHIIDSDPEPCEMGIPRSRAMAGAMVSLPSIATLECLVKVAYWGISGSELRLV